MCRELGGVKFTRELTVLCIRLGGVIGMETGKDRERRWWC